MITEFNPKTPAGRAIQLAHELRAVNRISSVEEEVFTTALRDLADKEAKGEPFDSDAYIQGKLEELKKQNCDGD